MPDPNDCNQNTDPLKLIRNGLSQDQRFQASLNPEYAPVSEHGPAHSMVFAHALSEFLTYYNDDNQADGNWESFFGNDVSVRTAVAAIQPLDDYRAQIKSYFDYLNDLDHEAEETLLKQNLSYLFSCMGSLARQLEILKEGLPEGIALKATLRNLIRSQLSASFGRLITYYKAGVTEGVLLDIIPGDSVPLLNTRPVSFPSALSGGFSSDWIIGSFTGWEAYAASLTADRSVFGDSSGSIFTKTNHIATHNLFTGISDQFLRVFARVVNDAGAALQETFTKRDDHDPHYALFLSFLRLMEYARDEMNTLTRRHLDFYYREVLQLKEKPAVPGKVHLLAELARHAESFMIRKDSLFKAGKDATGKDVLFAGNQDFVANQAKVSSLKTLYRHGITEFMPGSNPLINAMRMFASPVADSADGMGAKLTSTDQSWHPFFAKTYDQGKLVSVDMPRADVGLAIASHYLLLAEGSRTITLNLTVANTPTFLDKVDIPEQTITCLLTHAKGWIEKQPEFFGISRDGRLQIVMELSGADPAVSPYVPKVHGFTFDTDLPVFMLKLKNDDTFYFLYNIYQDIEVLQAELNVAVSGLKTLRMSNDFGPVDPSKPFQPFGALPQEGNALVIGSKEVFQKNLTSASVNFSWQAGAVAYGKSPMLAIDLLHSGAWTYSEIPPVSVASTFIPVTENLNLPVLDAYDPGADESYSTSSRQGFIRLRLTTDLGQKEYQTALLQHLVDKTLPLPATVPAAPVLGSVTLDYTAQQLISLGSTDRKLFESRKARYMHLHPFGFAEQHAALSKQQKVFFLPQFDFIRDYLKKETEAEFYIGITGLVPPQNLALLFQVADGTANPLSVKPEPHLHWSYLSGNEWIAFEKNEIDDRTGGFLKSGIVTLSVPAAASSTNHLLPPGEHWIRVAVHEKSDAVCRFLSVAAQAFQATFADRGNDPAFAASQLPAGTISKALVPDASLKKINQPFESFGGSGAEAPDLFYRRISERLRHKDRAISLWDYEHLVLEAFPEIYRVKCLNHTRYEPNETGTGIYREKAPGHVTLVTVPNQRSVNTRDPLKPYTSLGLLGDIETYLKARTTCFAHLHVRNPQFEQVRVKCLLKLVDGFDEAHYTRHLKESITAFLSPWAFATGSTPDFGGKIYKSVLIDFVEEQPYVDYVTDFELFHDINGHKGTENRNEIEGSLAVSILVSVPAGEHEITAIHPKEGVAPSEKCNCPS
jgi:hypothetical protein